MREGNGRKCQKFGVIRTLDDVSPTQATRKRRAIQGHTLLMPISSSCGKLQAQLSIGTSDMTAKGAVASRQSLLGRRPPICFWCYNGCGRGTGT